MQLHSLSLSSSIPVRNSDFRRFSQPSLQFSFSTHHSRTSSNFPPSFRISPLENRYCKLVRSLVTDGEGVSGSSPEAPSEDGSFSELVSQLREEEEAMEVVGSKRQALENQSLWSRIKEIVMFCGPATGLWICGPLMSLISTAVVGRGSSTELAALGPGTVFCDNMNLLFMFLSIATSNMVATSLATGDKNELQHQVSVLLFVAFLCGASMLLFTQFFGTWALTAFTGPKNLQIVPAATKYVQIRGLAWPAVLYGLVAQSASLGMKDSWGPLKALVTASAVNIIGHVVLCSFLRYGLIGAAWATLVSQIVAAYMMVEALNKKGYNAFAVSVPSPSEFLQIFGIAAPVFVTMFSKVAFYSLMTYFATAMGPHTVAAHQVMIQMFSMCAVFGEPLSQTAQSFMPELLYSFNRSLEKAQNLVKSLMMIGALFGLVIGTTGLCVSWLLPNIFTTDLKVIQEMHHVLVMFFIALSVAPCTLSLEGTLLAGRELKFMSLSMSGCFCYGALILWLVSTKGYGLPGCWCALVGFQWGRFLLAIWGVNGMLYAEKSQFQLGKLKAA